MKFTTLDEETRDEIILACQTTATNLTGCYGTYRRVRV